MRNTYSSGMEELAKTKKIRFGESSEEPEDQVWMKSPKNQPLKCPQTENASGKESKRRNVHQRFAINCK